ncbi:unnamed protein product [Moneuplotes crassus]|uniref:Uncharacterized protein n=1 Tax=Euplotes crassus TaxID=5936 RepID=A0AAD1XYL9_EUPCR|nr:unnamed protein product [Moneuplotes crassus]
MIQLWGEEDICHRNFIPDTIKARIISKLVIYSLEALSDEILWPWRNVLYSHFFEFIQRPNTLERLNRRIYVFTDLLSLYVLSQMA